MRELPDSYTNEDKLNWETEKLRVETYNLKRPYLRTPSSWLTILTVILASFGVTIQYYKSDREYQLAEIKRQQTVLEVKQIESDKQQLLASISETKNSLSQLLSQREEVANKFDLLKNQLNDLENQANLSAKGDTNEIKKTVQEVTQTINELKGLNEKAVTQSEQTKQDLQEVSTDLVNRQSQLSAFAVIASFPNLENALAYAKQIQATKPSFSVEVYRRSSNRIQVTLGGYLTPQEANMRVEYAKQQGIANDAYVRLAQDWGENLFK